MGFLPRLQQSNVKYKSDIINFAGINRTDSIKDNELASCKNVTFDNYPSVETRPQRDLLRTVTNPQALGAGTEKLFWVADQKFYYDGDEITDSSELGISTGTKNIIEYNNRILIFPDRLYTKIKDDHNDMYLDDSSTVIYVSGAGDITFSGGDTITTDGSDFPDSWNEGDTIYVNQAEDNDNIIGFVIVDNTGDTIEVEGKPFSDGTDSGIVILSKVPSIEYAVSFYNRVFGLFGNNINASELGDFNDFSVFEGTELDSWASNIYSAGDFTGIAVYRDKVQMFKDDFHYELYGKTPSQFSYQEIDKSGCLSSKSIAEVNSILMYLSRRGIMAYNGGIPRVLSEKLNEDYSNGGVAGTDGRHYYISLETDSSNVLYVYDTWTGLWWQEDDLNVIEFATLNGNLYALCDDGKMYRFNYEGSSEEIEWEIVTKNFTDETFNRKMTAQITVRMDLDEGATANIYYRVNQAAEWTLAKAITEGEFQRHVAVIPITRADSFQIKISGTGYAKIYGLERKFFMGSDV